MATIADGTGTIALAAFDTTSGLKRHEFGRPEVGSKGVHIDIQYCGMCHSDLHATNGDWGLQCFPLTPGHEIAGTVKAVGPDVKGFKVGDRVGVGCFVESCRSCECCTQGLEQHCPQGVQTYSSPFPEGKGENFAKAVGHHTNGGYSTDIVVDEHFVFQVPEKIQLEHAGPLLCAGITTFSPLNRHILQKGGGAGKNVGVVGFGGLGHMAVKLAKAMGASVTVFSRSDKKAAAAKTLGADLLVHSDEEALKGAARKFDVILDTVSNPHPMMPLVGTLKVGGSFVLVGGVAQPFEVGAFPLLFNRHSIEGTLVGGVPETKEMLEFCAKHDIIPDIKVIAASEASDQFKAMANGTAFAERAVIDMSTIKDLAEETVSDSH